MSVHRIREALDFLVSVVENLLSYFLDITIEEKTRNFCYFQGIVTFCTYFSFKFSKHVSSEKATIFLIIEYCQSMSDTNLCSTNSLKYIITIE
jgi:hypothetical protein